MAGQDLWGMCQLLRRRSSSTVETEHTPKRSRTGCLQYRLWERQGGEEITDAHDPMQIQMRAHVTVSCPAEAMTGSTPMTKSCSMASATIRGMHARLGMYPPGHS